MAEPFQTYRSFFTNEAIIASIGGNVKAWQEDNKPEYKCDCGNIVEEHEWVDELKMCKECYTEHFGDIPGHDEVEYKMEDR